jgi:SAM-dependent MidA family methyltransferase
VNLTALVGCAETLGLRKVGITTQSRFLVEHGILDGLDREEPDALTATKRRLQAKQLIHPLGMGATFKVAIFAKGS